MKITIESKQKTVQLDTPDGGTVWARVWEGTTESGIEVQAWITRIAVPLDQDDAQFFKELEEQRAPSPVVRALPDRMKL